MTNFNVIITSFHLCNDYEKRDICGRTLFTALILKLTLAHNIWKSPWTPSALLATLFAIAVHAAPPLQRAVGDYEIRLLWQNWQPSGVCILQVIHKDALFTCIVPRSDRQFHGCNSAESLQTAGAAGIGVSHHRGRAKISGYRNYNGMQMDSLTRACVRLCAARMWVPGAARRNRRGWTSKHLRLGQTSIWWYMERSRAVGESRCRLRTSCLRIQGHMETRYTRWPS